jgi:hypothetical protein
MERVQAASMRVPMGVEGQEVNVVHDMEAEVTMMSSRVKIPNDVTPQLREAEGTLSMADFGEKLIAERMAKISIEVGHQNSQRWKQRRR